MILKGSRADGRGPGVSDRLLRVGVLPPRMGRMFTRGETQSLAVVTLGRRTMNNTMR